MQLGMIGLGRMGANMARRLLAGGHQCVVFDMSPGISGDAVPSKRVGREKVRHHRGQAKSSEEVGLYGVRGTGAHACV